MSLNRMASSRRGSALILLTVGLLSGACSGIEPQTATVKSGVKAATATAATSLPNATLASSSSQPPSTPSTAGSPASVPNAPGSAPVTNGGAKSPGKAPAMPGAPAQASPVVYDPAIRLLYLSLRNMEPKLAPDQNAMSFLNDAFKAAPTAATLLNIRATLVNNDPAVTGDITTMCSAITVIPGSIFSCMTQASAMLMGGTNVLDVANILYSRQLYAAGVYTGARSDITEEFIRDFGITPEQAREVNLTNLYAGYSIDQVHADFVNTSYLADQIRGYLKQKGIMNEALVDYWHGFVASRSLTLQDVRINIQVTYP